MEKSLPRTCNASEICLNHTYNLSVNGCPSWGRSFAIH
uniref:Uncharacterized protein n=1 Tax=Anguilla anguilla TaxID=7936 RepID=A0A0E9U3E8_ANGAN